jgi:hypothetical protein
LGEEVQHQEAVVEVLDREKKEVLEVIEMQLQEENLVHFKEKKEHQGVLKGMEKNLLDVLLKLQKTEDQEKVNPKS